jgi:hypothetical protein
MLQPLWWRSTDVAKLIEKTLAADAQRADEESAASLLLVHDVSVYLMSTADTEETTAVFADGLDPTEDTTWTAKVRSHLPTDDFAEELDIEAMRALVAAAPEGWIRLQYDEAHSRIHVAAFAQREAA